MDAREFRTLVSRILYKPGWQFRVTAIDGSDEYGGRPRHVAVVAVEWTDNPDTNDPPLFERKDNFSPKDTVKVNYLLHSPEACLRQILECAIALELSMLVHEAREYFRVHDEDNEDQPWQAPFHPHHTGGVESQKRGGVNWQATSSLGLDSLKDLPRYSE